MFIRCWACFHISGKFYYVVTIVVVLSKKVLYKYKKYMCRRCVEAIKQIKEKTYLFRKKEICVHFTFLHSSQESGCVKKKKEVKRSRSYAKYGVTHLVICFTYELFNEE